MSCNKSNNGNIILDPAFYPGWPKWPDIISLILISWNWPHLPFYSFHQQEHTHPLPLRACQGLPISSSRQPLCLSNVLNVVPSTVGWFLCFQNLNYNQRERKERNGMVSGRRYNISLRLLSSKGGEMDSGVAPSSCQLQTDRHLLFTGRERLWLKVRSWIIGGWWI